MRAIWVLLLLLLTLPLAAEPFDRSRALLMEPVVLSDPQMGNREALRFLKPQGWHVEGGIRWYPDLAHLTCLEIRVSNPHGLEQLQTLRWARYCWFDNPVMPMQTGSNYMGEIVHPVMTEPADVVARFTIPTYRPGATVVAYQDLPGLARTLTQAEGRPVKAGRTRITYSVNGQPVEEDIYLALYLQSANLGTGTISYAWGPAGTPFGLRAAAGQLDAVTPKLLAVANSARVTPEWMAGWSEVSQLFQERQRQGIRNAAAISATISRNNAQVSQMISDAYWQRQASAERVAASYSDTIRGVTRYQSPLERYPVQLPSGYRNAYVDRQGNYILTDQDVTNTDWTRLEQAR